MTFTVEDALVRCGVQDFDAAELAGGLFVDDFKTCMDKTFEELNIDFKGYSDLTQAQGQIRLAPSVKNKIRAFIQWVRDEYRMGRDPSSTEFPVASWANLIQRYKTHERFVKNASTISDAAKPKTFTEDLRWEDWAPTFVNFLRALPGREGTPLKYVCHENDAPDPTPVPDNFLEEYINNAPLVGPAYNSDNAEVYAYLVNLIIGNQTVESKIQALNNQRDGRSAFMTLKDHYEGTGLNAVDIINADKILAKLHYSGEKPPYMTWTDFERQLRAAYAAYDRREKRVVHSNEMRLRTLMEKVNADFLQSAKTAFEIMMDQTPMTLTFEAAMTTFRNAVRKKFPTSVTGTTTATRGVRRQVQESNRGGSGRGGRGRGGRGGRGINSGRSGKRSQDPYRTRSDSEIVTLTDGSRIEYHPSFRFPADKVRLFPRELMDRTKREREEYKRNKAAGNNTNREIQELRAELQLMRQSSNPPSVVTAPGTSNQSHVSQVTVGTSGSTMMGGRNDQVARRGLP